MAEENTINPNNQGGETQPTQYPGNPYNNQPGYNGPQGSYGQPQGNYGQPGFNGQPGYNGPQGNYGQPGFNGYQTPPPPYGQYPGMNPMNNIPPEPGFIGSIKLFFSQYAQFSGRSRRQEYWYIVLFFMGVNFILSITGLSALSSIVTIACFIPNLALQCRRLHDIGKSGHWIWLDILSGFVMLFLLVYAILYLIVYIPGMKEELANQGFDYYSLLSLYSIVEVPTAIVIAGVIFWIAVKILFLVFNCTDSNRGTNQYGPSQKYPDQSQPSPWR